MQIIIPGHARTGTSVLFECLERSGYNGGPNLFGHKYKTQDKMLNQVRQVIDKYRTEDSCDTYGFNIGHFWRYVDENSITLLKDPELWMVFPMLFRDSHRFRQSWFIWMTRDADEVADSSIRLQEQYDMPPVKLNGKIDRQDRFEKYQTFLKVVEHYKPRTRSIVVDYHRLLDETDKVRRELEAFLMRDVNLSLVDKSETFAATGRAQ